jgi:hypothetical protein
MILTKQIFEQGRSCRGSWNYEQLRVLGLKTPLQSKWKKKVIGKDFSPEIISQFLSLKNKHLFKKRPKKAICATTRKNGFVVNQLVTSNIPLTPKIFGV